jgi:hypothetical protein
MGFTCFIDVIYIKRLIEWIRIDHGVSGFGVGGNSTIVSIFGIRFVSWLSFRITCS